MTWRVSCGDARKLDLSDESVHCVVTSVPYWGLRSYLDDPREIGREPTLDEWIANLVECAQEWRRMLRADGTLWVNCGDAYVTHNSGGKGYSHNFRSPDIVEQAGISQSKPKAALSGLKEKDLIGLPHVLATALRDDGWWLRSAIVWVKGIDWLSGERQAQEDVRDTLRAVREEAEGSLFGLSKGLDRALKRTEKAIDRLVMSGSVMPESVTDRPTSAYEMVFMFSKSKHYFFDQEAIRVNWSPAGIARQQCGHNSMWGEQRVADPRDNRENARRYEAESADPTSGRNPRNVWRIGTESNGTYILSSGKGVSHFASFPVALAERVIEAGTSEYGCCASCGAAFVRVIEREFVPQPDVSLQRGIKGCPGQKPMDESSGWDGYPRGTTRKTTIAWHPRCTCHGRSYRGLVRCGKCGGNGRERGYPRGGEPCRAEKLPGRNDLKRDHDGKDFAVIETGEPCPACLCPDCNGTGYAEYSGRWENGLPCPTCGGRGATGRVEGDIWPDNILAHWPIVPCTVLDPMAGSGTTGRAALNLGRSAILNDLKPEYAQLCRERLEAWPGDVPQKKQTRRPVENLEEMRRTFPGYPFEEDREDQMEFAL